MVGFICESCDQCSRAMPVAKWQHEQCLTENAQSTCIRACFTGRYYELESDSKFFWQVRSMGVDHFPQHYVAIRHQPGTDRCERSTAPSWGADLTHCMIARCLAIFLVGNPSRLPPCAAERNVAQPVTISPTASIARFVTRSFNS